MPGRWKRALLCANVDTDEMQGISHAATSQPIIPPARGGSGVSAHDGSATWPMPDGPAQPGVGEVVPRIVDDSAPFAGLPFHIVQHVMKFVVGQGNVDTIRCVRLVCRAFRRVLDPHISAAVLRPIARTAVDVHACGRSTLLPEFSSKYYRSLTSELLESSYHIQVPDPPQPEEDAPAQPLVSVQQATLAQAAGVWPQLGAAAAAAPLTEAGDVLGHYPEIFDSADAEELEIQLALVNEGGEADAADKLWPAAYAALEVDGAVHSAGAGPARPAIRARPQEGAMGGHGTPFADADAEYLPDNGREPSADTSTPGSRWLVLPPAPFLRWQAKPALQDASLGSGGVPAEPASPASMQGMEVPPEVNEFAAALRAQYLHSEGSGAMLPRVHTSGLLLRSRTGGTQGGVSAEGSPEGSPQHRTAAAAPGQLHTAPEPSPLAGSVVAARFSSAVQLIAPVSSGAWSESTAGYASLSEAAQADGTPGLRGVASEGGVAIPVGLDTTPQMNGEGRTGGRTRVPAQLLVVGAAGAGEELNPAGLAAAQPTENTEEVETMPPVSTPRGSLNGCKYPSTADVFWSMPPPEPLPRLERQRIISARHTPGRLLAPDLEPLLRLPNLRQLNIACPIPHLCPQQLGGLSGLTRLSLRVQRSSRLPFPSRHRNSVWQAVASLTALEELDLSHSSLSLRHVVSLSTLTSLKSLSLIGVRLPIAALNTFACLKQLTQLRIPHVNIVDDRFMFLPEHTPYFPELRDMLVALPLLRHLDLYWEGPGESQTILKATKHLATLAQAPQLRRLDLAKLGHITDSDLQRLSTLTGLTALKLGCNTWDLYQLRGRGLLTLKNCPHLRILHLEACRMLANDSFIAIICGAPQLEHLHLDSAQKISSAAFELTHMFTQLRVLELVDLTLVPNEKIHAVCNSVKTLQPGQAERIIQLKKCASVNVTKFGEMLPPWHRLVRALAPK